MSSPAPIPSRPDALLQRMGGLADPTRLRILRVLEREELSVLELCEVLKLPQSTASRHLKTLVDQEWLANRREGTASYYRLASALDPGARTLWQLARAEMEAWSVAQEDALRLEQRLRARRSEAESFFAGAASDWERLRAEVYGTRFELGLLLGLVPEEWTIADLGCGTGALTRALARSGARVVGVDRSAAMLRVARREARGLPNVELHQGALEALPLADRSCDAALLVLVLSYAAEVLPVLREARRVLKPGGRLLAVDAVAHADESFRRRMGQTRPGLDPAWLAAQLAEAGFAPPAPPTLLPAGAKRPTPDLFLTRAHRPRRS